MIPANASSVATLVLENIQFNPDIQLILEIDSQFSPNKNNNINHSGPGFKTNDVVS